MPATAARVTNGVVAVRQPSQVVSRLDRGGPEGTVRCGRERIPVRRSAISAALVVGAVAADGEQAHGLALYLLLAAVTAVAFTALSFFGDLVEGSADEEAGALYVGLTSLALVLLVIGAAVHANTLDGAGRSRARCVNRGRRAGAARPSTRRVDFVARESCPSGEGATQPHPGRVKPSGWNVWRGSCSAAGRPWSGSGSCSRSSACSPLPKSRIAGSSRSRSRATPRTRRTSAR